MKIRTKVPVTYNNGINSTSEAVIEGVIQNTSWVDEYSVLGANFKYQLEADEQGNSVVLLQNSFLVKGEEIETLYQAVKDQVPADLTYAETQQYLHYLGFVIEMAKTFDITPADIEIVA